MVLGGVGGDLVAEIMDISDATTTDDPSTITDPVALAFRRFADFTGADRLADAPIVITPGDHSGR